jgi:hypothetical protein
MKNVRRNIEFVLSLTHQVLFAIISGKRTKKMNKMPIFQPVFGDDWPQLPPVLQQHYANRPYTRDVITFEGSMAITASPLARALSPLLRLSGALVPYEGSDIPVTVHFRSEPDSAAYGFDREFRFPGRKPYRFRSRMLAAGANEVIELMRSGLGWRAACRSQDGKVIMQHRGYALRIFGRLLPLPFGLLLGRVYAEEEALTDDRYRMYMEIRHPWFGRIYTYSGEFTLKQINLHE